MEGTTFSGLSTRTTLGNTLRSLMYFYFYMSDAGISREPWNDPNLFVMASGDDTVCFIKSHLSTRAVNAILERTARDSSKQVVSLG